MNKKRSGSESPPPLKKLGEGTSPVSFSPGGIRSRSRRRVGSPSPASSSAVEADNDTCENEGVKQNLFGSTSGVRPWVATYDKGRLYQPGWFLKHTCLQRYDIGKKESAICSACSHREEALFPLGNKLDTINKHMSSARHIAAVKAHGSKGPFKPQPTNILASMFLKQVRRAIRPGGCNSGIIGVRRNHTGTVPHLAGQLLMESPS